MFDSNCTRNKSNNVYGHRYGKLLLEKYEALKDAEKEVTELVLCVQSHWIKMSKQLGFLRRVWETLDEDHQIMQNQVLQVLVSKLREAVVKIEGVLHKRDDKYKTTPNNDSTGNHGDVKRWKYALVKDCLEKAVQDLDRWQNTFDPTWFLIMKIADPVIDQQLAEESTNSSSISTAKGLRGALADEPKEKTSIFLPENGLYLAKRHEIPYSTAQMMRRPNSTKDIILDPVVCDASADVPTMTKDVRDLARRLSQTDPLTFGLLSCRGVVKTLSANSKRVGSFDFVFNVPEGLTQPKSLRSILITGDSNHALSDRFKVAKQLAKSVNYIHTYQFVHKNIRPETIVVFQDRNSVLGAPFLLGFQKFRFVEGKTKRLGDSEWERDLYRHPRRQGLNPEEDYKMQHDIYSLGVCLLEIGLWISFVNYDDNADGALPSSVLCNVDFSGKDKVKKAFDIKNTLVNLAREQLPSRMGHMYTDIVVNCLTCLDSFNVDFGDENEFQDADGVLVGVRYIEKVSPQPEPKSESETNRTRSCIKSTE